MTMALVILGLIILALLWDRRTERREHAEQIASLCQRLQAPEVAVMRHQLAEMPPSPPAVPFDDDAAYHEVQSATREDLAAALARRP